MVKKAINLHNRTHQSPISSNFHLFFEKIINCDCGDLERQVYCESMLSCEFFPSLSFILVLFFLLKTSNSKKIKRANSQWLYSIFYERNSRTWEVRIFGNFYPLSQLFFFFFHRICKNCKRTSSRKTSRTYIGTWPSILVIHFERFKLEGCFPLQSLSSILPSMTQEKLLWKIEQKFHFLKSLTPFLQCQEKNANINWLLWWYLQTLSFSISFFLQCHNESSGGSCIAICRSNSSMLISFVFVIHFSVFQAKVGQNQWWQYKWRNIFFMVSRWRGFNSVLWEDTLSFCF